MWQALIRQIVLFIFTKRGKRIAVFVGMTFLCFVTAFLIDSRMYLSGGFLGAVTLVAFITIIVQYFRQRRKQRARIEHKMEKEIRRTEAAQARSEQLHKAKSAVAGAAKAASSGAAGFAGRAKMGLTQARDRLGSLRRRRRRDKGTEADHA